MSTAPHYHIDVAAFHRDPYPDLARLRAEMPIAYVPELGATIFTKRDAIFTNEKIIEVFSSHQPGGLKQACQSDNLIMLSCGCHNLTCFKAKVCLTLNRTCDVRPLRRTMD